MAYDPEQNRYCQIILEEQQTYFSPNNNSHGDFIPNILEGVRLIKYVAVMSASLHKNLGTFIVNISERELPKHDDSFALLHRFGEVYLDKTFDEEYPGQTKKTQR